MLKLIVMVNCDFANIDVHVDIGQQVMINVYNKSQDNSLFVILVYAKCDIVQRLNL